MLTAKDIGLMKHIFLTKDDKKDLFTKKDFVEAKKDLFTKKDFVEAKKDLFTKKDFVEAKKDLLTKKEFMLEMADHPRNQDFTDFKREVRNDILTFKDEILTEIVELRLETTVNSSFRGRIEKQDKRIERLETAVFN